MPKIPLDQKGSLYNPTHQAPVGCLRSGRSNPGPLLLEKRFERSTAKRRSIMTSTKSTYGCQDFFSLDIP